MPPKSSKSNSRGTLDYSEVVAGVSIDTARSAQATQNAYIDSALQKLRKEISHDFELALNEKFKTLNTQLVKQNEQIDILKNVILQQQNDLLIIKRKELNTNIIIYGVPESEATSPADDITSVKNIFSEIVMDDITPVSQFRLGKPNFTLGKPRSLKIVLASSDQKNTLLQNAKKLRNNANFKAIYINRDEPKEDRIENSRLRSALLEHKKQHADAKLIRGKIMLNDTVLDSFDPHRQLFRASE